MWRFLVKFVRMARIENNTEQTVPRRRGRPRDPTITEAERRAHRRLKPKQTVQPKQTEPEPLVTLTLRLAHNRNGSWIGPGVVMVPQPLAHELRYAEEQQAYQAQKLQDFWKGDIG